MTARCPDRIKGWAVVRPEDDPFNNGPLRWWAFDVFRTRREALRCKAPEERIVRVVVKRG